MADLHEKQAVGSKKGGDFRLPQETGQALYGRPPRILDGRTAEPDSRVEYEYQSRK